MTLALLMTIVLVALIALFIFFVAEQEKKDVPREYGSLSCVMAVFVLLMLIFAWRIFTRDFAEDTVNVTDEVFDQQGEQPPLDLQEELQ